MDLNTEEASADKLTSEIKRIGTLYQYYLDQLTPHVKYRWAALGGLVFLFIVRIIISQGWYVVCYALGIYLLNQFLAFLTPKFDVSLQQNEQNEEMEAGEMTDEFRPFIRRLPEFKFWHNSIRATVLCFFMTFFSVFDIPVFWPILLMYFIVLFALTMRRQINHMIKYKYVPLDIGKKKYASK
ncbi:Rer1 [Kluyveromyces lactis]|nr:Rer1 [Kluyveromyces lactis]